MEQQTYPRFRLCQFVLSPEGRILACPQDAAERVSSPEADVRGKHLRDVLLHVEQSWGDLIPEDLSQWPEQLFLPWGQKDEPGIMGLSLELMRSDEGIVATTSPSLAPANELEEGSLAEVPQNPAVVKQLFLRLRTAESRLNNYLHNLPGIFFSQRPDLSFSYIGPGLAEKLGVDVRPFMRNGGRFLDLILHADRSTVMTELEKGSTSGGSFSLTYRMRHASAGNLVYLMDVRTPRMSPSGLLLGYEGVWLDVTRQSIAEARLSRTAWKESLATITSGLIHDFSNVMAGIFSLSELYYSSLDKDHEWYRGMGQIMESSHQARKLVRRIIDLNREQSGQPNYHNLENLLTDQLDLIRAILPKQNVVETDLTGEELAVFLDDVSFRQMILNMAMNSRDAMSRDGHIRIGVQKVAEGQEVCEDCYGGPFKAPREGALICFEDNGSGIPQDHLARVWDPFFTTKEASKGSGFGLYNARLFIAQCKGRLAVESKLGVGTKFHIYIPLADFTESLEMEDEEDALAGGQHRPCVAVYAGIDPSDFDLIARMHEKEWELISFSRPEALRRYLREAPRFPNLLLVLLLGADVVPEDLLDEMRVQYPSMKQALMIIGQSSEEVSCESMDRLDLVIEDAQTPDETVRMLEGLIKKSEG